jgi:hypothetical protein
MRKDITRKERDLLLLKSGGICAFPGCNRRLIEPGNEKDDATALGQIAHIIASSHQGPRGTKLLTEDDLNKHTNLILLCGEHHKIIDAQPNTYSVPVLQQIKADHEARIRTAMAPGILDPPPPTTSETVHSTLLPLTHLPANVFAAPCSFGPAEAAEVRR